MGESEFQKAFEQVRKKAPQRFSHAREALRILDVDYDGRIERGEMTQFFLAFGVLPETSNKIFDRMALNDTAEYRSFVNLVGAYLDLPGIVAAMGPLEMRCQ